MLENTENLCESVTMGFALAQPKTDWKEEVFLAQSCKERFLTQSDLPELTDNGFFMAGLAELAEGYEIERVATTNHTLLLTLEGVGLLTLTERQYHLMPNTLTILPAGLPFRFELADKRKGWKMAWVLLKPGEKWLPLVTHGQRVEHSHICEQVWSVMNLLHSEIGGRASYRKLFASELSRLMLGSANLAPSNSVLRVQSVFNDIESQLHLNWTVRGIAKQCFLSTEQLNRITKQLYGCSTQQRLIQLRMEKAVDLLYYREWTIGMVAQRLGYQDPFNFTHRFRQYHGCSPREYRKRLLLLE
ncbi:AraC family transcriptional regulator (plasmid) [Photobacterium sp. DA100]|uniref:AraC family transcriptional regulator n=1 Tax=Photobacterium sp. DA100 TaxID=3027472 RepID=UPI002479FF06|nr:AraC family transcriptional regulator [Photobacterium sp. DA100]WEM45654.1 AraC family transcriptional regulator [Photobacterium sp. DA100]